VLELTLAPPATRRYFPRCDRKGDSYLCFSLSVAMAIFVDGSPISGFGSGPIGFAYQNDTYLFFRGDRKTWESSQTR